MVDRIIVRAKASSRTTPRSTQSFVILRAAVPVFLANVYAIHLFWNHEVTWMKKYCLASLIESAPSSMLTTLVATLCLLIVWAARTPSTSIISPHTRGVSVSLYHVGVQLTTVWMSKDNDSCICREKYLRFIPRDQIIDCIVTEVVLAHRVQSVVVLRLHHNIQKTKAMTTNHQTENGSIQLVNAFPGVDLNYSECCVIRRRIKLYLDGPK